VLDAGGGDDDVGSRRELFQGSRFESSVARLEKPCRIPFGHADRATEGSGTLGDAVSDETEAYDDDAFAVEAQHLAQVRRLPIDRFRGGIVLVTRAHAAPRMCLRTS